MSQKGQNGKDGKDAMNKVVAALKTGAGLKDDFIYYMSVRRLQKLPRSVSAHLRQCERSSTNR